MFEQIKDKMCHPTLSGEATSARGHINVLQIRVKLGNYSKMSPDLRLI